MSKGQIIFDAPITLDVQKDKVGFVSHGPEFDIYSQGDTRESARENLKEAITLFLETCYEHGTLLDVLEDCGFKPKIKPVKNIEIKPLENINMIRIPYGLFSHAENHAN